MTLHEFTKLSYVVLLWLLVLVPLGTWALLELDGNAETQANMQGIGSYIAGLGVPMGALTAAMAAKRASESRNAQK